VSSPLSPAESFSHSHQTGSDWRSICDKLLQDLPQDVAGKLAFIYIADSLAGETDRIIDYLRARTGVPHWVGSVAQGICSTGRETYEEAAIALLLTDLGENDFRIMPPVRDNPKAWLDSIADWRQQQLASVAVVHGDPSHQQIPATIEQLADQLDGGFLVGGLTSSQNLQVQIADKAVGAGLSGVLFGAGVQLSTGLSQGASLIGQRHQITGAEQNIISHLDGRPALEVFKEEIGEELAENLQQVGGLIFAALPVAGSDTGDYLVRNLIGIDPEKQLLAIGDLAQVGSDLQFARRDRKTAIADLQRMIETLKSRLPGEPKGALYHTCLGRGRYQFGEDSAELKLIRDHLGDVPLIGFYANGEIEHRRLYGYTGVLSVFCQGTGY